MMRLYNKEYNKEYMEIKRMKDRRMKRKEKSHEKQLNRYNRKEFCHEKNRISKGKNINDRTYKMATVRKEYKEIDYDIYQLIRIIN